ncbi:MAG: 3-methylornithyl-N6-L-lysine dehydrogenase PylD [Desulfopila sp.]
MTLLKASDIVPIVANLSGYNRRLRSDLGCSLAELACLAAAVSATSLLDHVRSLQVVVVPMSCGEGVIDNFGPALCRIATLLGFRAALTSRRDVGGLAEALSGESDILLVADDDTFIALNRRTGRMADNAVATGRGFATALAQMAGGLSGRPALVLGCGPVGRSGAIRLAELGAVVSLYDVRPELAHRFAADYSGLKMRVATDLTTALMEHALILEATPVADTIGAETITTTTCVAAAGVPCGVTVAARKKLGARLFWDPLQLGVATMLIEVARQEPGG